MGYCQRAEDEELRPPQMLDLPVLQKDYCLVAVDEEARHQVPVHHLAVLAPLEQVEPREDVASRKQAQ